MIKTSLSLLLFGAVFFQAAALQASFLPKNYLSEDNQADPEKILETNSPSVRNAQEGINQEREKMIRKGDLLADVYALAISTRANLAKEESRDKGEKVKSKSEREINKNETAHYLKSINKRLNEIANLQAAVSNYKSTAILMKYDQYQTTKEE